MSDINRRKASAEKQAVFLRNYQRQRGRALTRLSQEYPNRYKELLEEERARDEAEGKSWLDIAGRTIGSMGGAGTPDRNSSVSESYTNGDEQEARHLGGEA